MDISKHQEDFLKACTEDQWDVMLSLVDQVHQSTFADGLKIAIYKKNIKTVKHLCAHHFFERHHKALHFAINTNDQAIFNAVFHHTQHDWQVVKNGIHMILENTTKLMPKHILSSWDDMKNKITNETAYTSTQKIFGTNCHSEFLQQLTAALATHPEKLSDFRTYDIKYVHEDLYTFFLSLKEAHITENILKNEVAADAPSRSRKI